MMTPLSPPPRIRLSRLRDIGWALWDPIGLLREGQKWDDADALAFADEYDSYLIEAAGMIRRGTPEEAVIARLVAVETGHIGLDPQPDRHDRARATVEAIKADRQLWTPAG